jgi:hypothetical protein
MTPIEIEKIFRDEAGRALATLIRLVGDFWNTGPPPACHPIRVRGW